MAGLGSPWRSCEGTFHEASKQSLDFNKDTKLLFVTELCHIFKRELYVGSETVKTATRVVGNRVGRTNLPEIF